MGYAITAVVAGCLGFLFCACLAAASEAHTSVAQQTKREQALHSRLETMQARAMRNGETALVWANRALCAEETLEKIEPLLTPEQTALLYREAYRETSMAGNAVPEVAGGMESVA